MLKGKLLVSTAVLFALTLISASCIPQNGSLKNTSKVSKSTSLSKATSALAASDGAAGICAELESGTTDRSTCISCYSSVLTIRCPGKTAPSACIDQSVIPIFDSLVNQCLSASIQAGFTCTKTCSGGLILNGPTCSCVTPVSTGTGGTVDTGQQDYGPPIVSLYMPNTFGSLAGADCSVTNYKARFLVRNRGSSVPNFNVYSVVGTPSCSDAAVDSFIAPTPVAPALDSTTLLLQSTLNVKKLNALTGDYSIGVVGPSTTSVIPAVPVLAAGQHELEIDLRLFNDWKGNQGPHWFEIMINGVRVFAHTFSNDFTAAGTGAPVGASQSFTPRAVLTGSATMGNDTDADAAPTNAAGTFYYDSRYLIRVPFYQPIAAAPTIIFGATGLNGFPAATKSWKLPFAAIRRLGTCGVKYSFTDSNQQTSYYCFRFSPHTGYYTYSLLPPTPDPSCRLDPIADGQHWTAISSTAACP